MSRRRALLPRYCCAHGYGLVWTTFGGTAVGRQSPSPATASYSPTATPTVDAMLGRVAGYSVGLTQTSPAPFLRIPVSTSSASAAPRRCLPAWKPSLHSSHVIANGGNGSSERTDGRAARSVAPSAIPSASSSATPLEDHRYHTPILDQRERETMWTKEDKVQGRMHIAVPACAA
jgi:hypothetical protein